MMKICVPCLPLKKIVDFLRAHFSDGSDDEGGILLVVLVQSPNGIIKHAATHFLASDAKLHGC